MTDDSHKKWRTKGLWRPGRRWEVAPLPPRRIKLASIEGALPRYRGSGAEPQPSSAPAVNAFGSIWVYM